MFELASRSKLTFQTPKGTLSVDYLWDLPLTTLDTMYREITRRIRAEDEESLISPTSNANRLDLLRNDLIKHIVKVRQTESNDKLTKASTKAKISALEEALARKTEAQLADMPIESLQEQIKKLSESL